MTSMLVDVAIRPTLRRIGKQREKSDCVTDVNQKQIIQRTNLLTAITVWIRSKTGDAHVSPLAHLLTLVPIQVGTHDLWFLQPIQKPLQ
jgi:hypothetical protein